MGSFDDIRENKYLGLTELATAAERFLKEMPQEQRKGSVTRFPNERAVRFYLSKGLLEAPEGKRGPMLVFGHAHLIELLTVKRLQAEGLPISVIKTFITSKSVEQLETFLSRRLEILTEQQSLDTFIQESGKLVGDAITAEDSAKATKQNEDDDEGENKAVTDFQEDYEPLKMIKGRRSSPGTARDWQIEPKGHSGQPPTQADPASPGSDARGGSFSGDGDPKQIDSFDRSDFKFRKSRSINRWNRVEIADGLEIHIKDSFESTNPDYVRAMLAAIENVLVD